ncbi:MAG: DUF937 domain-containing protein [Burkholderiaceae bacterium]
MNITDILAQTGGLQSVARELGVSETEAASGAEALLPAILGGFKKQVQSQPTGVEGLGGLLGQLGGGGLLDQMLAPQPTDVSRGNDVLGQIFGSKDVSRTVAQNAAAQSGLDPGVLRKMLPMLAMLVAGFMAKQQSASAASAPAAPAGGGLGGLLGGLLGGGGVGAGSGAMPGGTASGLGSLLDLNGDGNPLDDILRMAGKAMR